MNEVHTPDSFVIFSLDVTDVMPDRPIMHKLLAGWSGGYLDGDAWRINSGITYTEFNSPELEDVLAGDHISVYGSSGSRYDVRMSRYAMRMSMAGIWKQISDNYPTRAKLLDEAEALAYLKSIERQPE